MKKVNLDKEYDKWRNKNLSDLEDRWSEIVEDKFEDFVEENWREYQQENDLFDKSNEVKQ